MSKVRLIKLTSFITLLLILSPGCDIADNGRIVIEKESKANELLLKCKKLKIGMKYDEVINMMGKPINTVQTVDQGRLKERLYFSSPSLASTFTQCLIDKQSGLLEEAICGEDYKLP
jgi:hypothetical protein